MTRSCATLLVLSLLASALQADEWPQWRGPRHDNTWNETGLIQKFPGPEIKLRWRVPIAGGYSGPTVCAGRVYVTDRVTEPQESERVHCFDWSTGKKLWTHAYPCDYKAIQYKAGPRAAVTIAAGRAYALGSVGHFHCLDAATGEVIWKKDLVAEHKTEVPIWGMASAPLVEGPMVILIAGGRPEGAIMAFDTRTGKVRWSALSDPIAYSSPMMIDQAGKRVVVCWTAKRIVGLDVTSGKLLWEHPYEFRRWCDAILTPTRYKDRLFISSFTEGSLLLRLAQDRPAVEQVWRRVGRDERRTDSLHCCMSNPVIADEFIYGFDAYGQFRCLEAGMGNRVWENVTFAQQERWGGAHMIPNLGRVWVFNDRGELIICRLSNKGPEEISRAKLLRPTRGQLNRGEGVTWSPPAFAYRHVFNRNDEELVCASLSAEDAAPKKEWWKRLKN